MATKLPFMQLYPDEYLRDTRVLSLPTKGGWIDILCALHHAPQRGQMTHPVSSWARLLGATVEETVAVLEELRVSETAIVDIVSIRDISGHSVTRDSVVTVKCRRMVREASETEAARKRKQRQRVRERGESEHDSEQTAESAMSRESHAVEARSQKPEAINHSTEVRTNKVVAGVPEIALEHPESSQPALTGFEPAAMDPVVLTFPTSGRGGDSWELRESLVQQIQKAYPDLNVRNECDLALLKIVNGVVTKKTTGGMKSFLFNWMDRAQNRPRAGGANGHNGHTGGSKYGRAF